MAAHHIGPFIDFGRYIRIFAHRGFLDVAAGSCCSVNRYPGGAASQAANYPQVDTMATVKDQVAALEIILSRRHQDYDSSGNRTPDNAGLDRD
jgi:hypothetical protein